MSIISAGTISLDSTFIVSITASNDSTPEFGFEFSFLAFLQRTVSEMKFIFLIYLKIFN